MEFCTDRKWKTDILLFQQSGTDPVWIVKVVWEEGILQCFCQKNRIKKITNLSLASI